MSIPGGVLLAQRSGKGLGTVPKFPVITGSATVSINENTTAVATYTADEAVTWSLAGTDAARFQINSSGVLSFVTAPDFEAPADADADNIYLVTVRAVNASEGNMSTLPVIVTVQDVAVENPIITGSTTVSAAENQTAVASYTADRTVTWSISGGADSAKFQINSSGVLTFITAPDFEAPGDANGDNVYQVTIAATDTNSLVGTLTVLVTVTDAVDPLYVEDVFSTYLYTGTSGAQTITNGIDLAGKGGLVWQKRRDAATDHYLFDTARGGIVSLASNSTSTGTNWGDYGLTYNSNGFTILSGFSTSATFASWTFRKAPKFFDVVTATADASGFVTVNHSLGVAPGFAIVKATSTTSGWNCYHQSLGTTKFLQLNNTNAAGNASGWVATSTSFTGLTTADAQVVIYLFAHDTTSDGIIQCGSYTGNGSSTGPSVTLGWEPQWVMVKKASSGVAPSDWFMFDNMRGMPVASAQTQFLSANTTGSEIADTTTIQPTSTGFQLVRNYSGTNANGETYIYIAIRRGPMRTPTSGTSVFSPFAVAGNSATRTLNSAFPADLYMCKQRNNVYNTNSFLTYDRLRGRTNLIETNLTSAEQSFGLGVNFDNNDGVVLTGGSGYTNAIDANYLHYLFRRAPSFFDVVCYTGNSTANRTISHNLGVAPELVILKGRSNNFGWPVYTANLLGTTGLGLNSTWQNGYWDQAHVTAMSASVVTLGSPSNYGPSNLSGNTYVAYLFASCPGVSKVGSYTGNGSTQVINCGFTNGARFVMIKRTDAAEHWHVFDTARGINAGVDPGLRISSDIAEFTSEAINPNSSGFTVVQSASCNNNVSGATYIYLAIA